MQNLIVTVMGDNGSRFIDMCFNSILDADKIIFCWGMEDKETLEKAKELFDTQELYHGEIIQNPYNQEDKCMNGKTRNYYLNYLKQNYPNDWCLCIDLDEVVEDLSKVKQFIQEAQPGIYSPRMRHFIGDLSKEDAIQPAHYVLNRLFKISEAGNYPETEHPVLQFKKHENDDLYYSGNIPALVIWHLGYINGVFDINKKYNNHMKKSNMHTPEYLYQWNMAHILGIYPTKPVNVLEIPKIILDNFGIEKDAFYFADRGLKPLNFLMTKDWMSLNPKSVLDLGCGLGNYGYVFRYFYGVNYKGMDISNFAVKINPYKLDLTQGSIVNYFDKNIYDLVLCVDILEHLTEQELDKTLENIKGLGTNYIFSIPFIGDPNLTNDPTHKIHQTKDWWINKLNSIFVIREAPSNWVLSNQLLIGTKR